MNIAELKEKHPDLVALIAAEVSAASSVNVSELSASITQKDEIIASLTKENDSLKKSVIESEKEKLQASISAANILASSIFENTFSASSIPEHFKAKVEKQVAASAFISAEGVLDSDSYTSAVKEEITDWESSFSGSSVAGVGSSDNRTAGEDGGLGDEASSSDDAYADELMKLV